MKIIHCSESPLFIAGDRSILREILNPRKNKLKINYSLARACVRKDHKTIPHRLRYTEVYYVLKGKGKMHIDRQVTVVKKDDTIYIPAGAIQYIENTGAASLEFLCIVNPPWRPACEIIIGKNRFSDKRSKH